MSVAPRVLVTGAYGYVGGRVAQTLAGRGWDVALGTRRASAATAPDWLPGARPQRLDWDSTAQLEAACAGIQAIVHLAAMNEAEAAQDPAAALRVNGIGSLHLLEAAVAARVPRFVYLSTAHVYGAPLIGEIDECRVPRPAHPYSITHKVAEDFVLAASDAGRIEGVVLRLSNGFGVPAHSGIERWTLLVNDLCRQAATRKAMHLHSAGLQRRDFITLEDASSAIAHVLALPTMRLGDGLFNLGGDASIRIVDMAQLIALRCEATLGFVPSLQTTRREGETETQLRFSSKKFQDTGFAPKRQHENEIDATLRFCARVFRERQM